MKQNQLLRRAISLLQVVLLYLFFIQGINAQVSDCNRCTSNDFTFNSFYLGDASGNALSSGCTVGSSTTAYLWMNVTSNATRYSLNVYYFLTETNPSTNTSTTTTVSNCLYLNQAIPMSYINLGTVTWTCGNQLSISNFQMAWKQQQNLGCSYDDPKCMCIAGTQTVSSYPVGNYTYTGCNNGSTTTVSFNSTISGGIAPFTYAWTFGNGGTSTLANPVHTYANPGPYTATLTIMDSENRTTTRTQTVTLPAALTAPTVSTTQPTCSTPTGTIVVSSPTGSGITYSINGSSYQSSNTFTGVSAGTYNVTYKNASGCTSAATVVVINAAPTVTAPTVTVTQPTCTTATGTITISAPTGTGLTYSIDGTNYQSSTTFSNVASGSYNVTVKNASGCVSTVTVATVNAQPATPAAATVSVTQPTCTVATGIVTITAPTGTGLTYSIDGTNYQSSTTFSNVASGSYNVTVKNANGCTSTATVATVNAQPATPAAATVSVTQPTCTVATGTITITAPTGTGLTYSIDGTNYQSSTTFSNVASGSYNVTVKNASGCVSTATVATINAQPATPAAATVSAGGPTSFCTGGSVVLTSSSTTGNQWYLNGVAISGATNQTYTATTSGNYTVRVTNSGGCTSAASNAITVTANAYPTVAAITGLSTLCTGDSITLSNTTTGGVWSSSNTAVATENASTGVVKGITQGTATINYTVTNSNGCSTTVSKTISVWATPPTPTITVSGPATRCIGDSVKLSSSSGYSTYQWYRNGVAIVGATGADYYASQAGTYTFTVTGTMGNNCVSLPSAGVNVSLNPCGPCDCSNFRVSINVNQLAQCVTGNAFQFSANILNGGGSYTYLWNFGDGTTSTLANPTHSYATAGEYDITLTVNDVTCNCTAHANTIQVYVGAKPTASFNISNNNCNTRTFISSSTIGAGWLDYQWNLGNGQTSNLSNPTASYAIGTYTATLVAIGNFGCRDTTAQTFTIGTCVDAIMPPNNCQKGFSVSNASNNCDSTVRFNTYNGVANMSITYYFGDGTQQTVVPIAPTYNTNITHKYNTTGSFVVKQKVTVTGAGSCTDSTTQTIYVNTCNVTSGGGGGVESKSLGNVMAQRLFGNAINNKPQQQGRTDNLFVKNSGVIVNGVNDLKLADLLPETVVNTDKSYISSPTDLVNFTNANEVLSIDYTSNSTTKAVAFATKTLGEAYNHTKPICDRLKGAELLEVNKLTIKGIDLMAYKIRQRTGEIEYAVNMNVGTKKGRDNATIQSNWFTNSLVADETMFNIQLWAVSYTMVGNMANTIITNIKNAGSLQAATATDLPLAYISKGNRENTNLNLTLQNNTTATNGYFELKEKANENSSEVTRQIPFTVIPNGTSQIQLAVNDKYEASIYVYLNNKLTDLVYLSDGSWNVDYNKANTTITKFDVINEPSINQALNERRLLRNVAVAGVSKDYITIYKTMMGGGLEQNVSNFQSLLFNANATGASSVTVTLIKKSITNWNEQYSYTMPLDGNKDYGINLNQFKSGSSVDAINANDITAVNFSFNSSRGVPTNMSINLSKARFSTQKVDGQLSTVSSISVYPNPASGSKFTTSFTSETAQPMVLRVIETSTGKIVKTQFINATKGTNQVAVALNNEQANGLYIVSLEADGVKYNAAKLMVSKK